jgi:metallo-beta-lactamase family protein
MTGLSGHADKDGLTKWVNAFTVRPKRVFLVHGDDRSCIALAESLRLEYKHNTYAPYSGTVFNLLSNQLEYEGMPIKAKKQAAATNAAFTRLLTAAKRLLAYVESCVGHANKDLAKMTDQINALTDKWNGRK